jgi:hemerythrin
MLLMWTENMSVGVKTFDEDHKSLIRMMNAIHEVLQNIDEEGKIPSEEIEAALHQLENYVRYHCNHEEVAMAKTDYAELEEHKQEHTKLAAMVAEMSWRFHGSTDPRHIAEIMQFIYDWLTNHINVTDKKYTAHLNARGIF